MGMVLRKGVDRVKLHSLVNSRRLGRAPVTILLVSAWHRPCCSSRPFTQIAYGTYRNVPLIFMYLVPHKDLS